MVSNDKINKKLKNRNNGTNEIKCSSCGSKNPMGSIFCKECGTKLLKGQSPVDAAIGKSREDKTGENSFLRKIPGFRSHTPWKMILSSVLYLLVVIFVVLLCFSALTPSYPTIQISKAPVTLVNNSSSSTDGMMINVTMKSDSNINVLPVGVYSNDEYIGSFIMTNITPNQDLWFRFNVNDSDTSISSIDTSQGNLDFLSYGISSSYSLSPGDYKLVIGDENVNMSTSELDTMLEPIINDYNESKGSESDSIKIQGTVVGDYSSTSSFPTYSNVTIFLKLGGGQINQGEYVYTDTGEVVNAYQYYEDVVVIYWPEMKIAGWHRIMGTPVPDRTYGYGGDIYGDPVTTYNVTTWIDSLPHA